MTNGNTILKILWIAGIFLFLGLVLSAVERKRSSDSLGLKVTVLDSLNMRFVKEQDVKSTIKRRFGHVLNGVPIGHLDAKEVEDVLEKDPFIKDANVFVDAQNDVNVTIHQRKPLVHVIDNAGNNYYLDEEGEYMPMSANYTARVLVATGRITSYHQNYRELDEHILQDLLKLVRAINSDKLLTALIEQIYIDGEEEFSIIPKVGSYRVVIGKMDRLQEKMKYLKIFYKEGLPYEDWKKYSIINLKFRGQVVCTKR